MKKTYIKLAMAFFALILSAIMIVSVTYAWTTLSKNPVAGGIQLSVGGTTTIMLAPDIAETLDDGTVVHYPGEFSNDKLNFDNIEGFSGLSPVSTSNGLNWIIPEYDEETGRLRNYTDFTVDRTLSMANDSSGRGKYVYLDFWIVSPGSEYNVHISTDSKTGEGSFVMEVPGVVSGDTASGYTHDNTMGIAESSARIGFLVNDSRITEDGAMLSYLDSKYYDSRYKSLKGRYQEKGEYAAGFDFYNFTIYEPNADLHPLFDSKDIYITYPLAYNQNAELIYEADIGSRVAVQKSSSLKTTDNGILLEDILQAALLGKNVPNKDDARSQLYDKYLQWQISRYITSGQFFKNTDNLYAHADKNGKISAEIIENNDAVVLSGATDDVVIAELEKNVPQRIRMFVWLEGQDIDCSNNSCIQKTGFAVNLELSGESE